MRIGSRDGPAAATCEASPRGEWRRDVMESAYPVRRLSLVDCTSITVGIIIGSGIYESMGLVAGQAADVWELAGLWIAGGVFALLGSLCYAELATRFPEEGGDYVYLTKAFGRPLGFLFAWTQLWIIRPGSIGALACVFADYATRLHSLGSQSFMLYACGSIGLLTLLNMLGVRQSTWVQNLLTGVKILGLVTLVVAGLLATPAEPTAAAPTAGGSLSFAMIFVLFAYSGWNEMGCVASEVRDPRRNILRSLLAGSAIVTLIYLGLNAACWKLLDFRAWRRRRPSRPKRRPARWALPELRHSACSSASRLSDRPTA